MGSPGRLHSCTAAGQEASMELGRADSLVLHPGNEGALPGRTTGKGWRLETEGLRVDS